MPHLLPIVTSLGAQPLLGVEACSDIPEGSVSIAPVGSSYR